MADCGGSSLCKHQRQRSMCKDCGGSSFCEHQRRRSTCKDCGGSIICEHQCIRSSCKDCKGSRHSRDKKKNHPCLGVASYLCGCSTADGHDDDTHSRDVTEDAHRAQRAEDEQKMRTEHRGSREKCRRGRKDVRPPPIAIKSPPGKVLYYQEALVSAERILENALSVLGEHEQKSNGTMMMSPTVPSSPRFKLLARRWTLPLAA
jgi:hypothetical protein